MKKTLLLSVVASTMIMAGGDIAPVEPVVEAPAVEAAGWDFTGSAVLYYQTVSDNAATPNQLATHTRTGDLFDHENSSASAGIQLGATNSDLFAGIGAGIELTGLSTLGLASGGDVELVSAAMQAPLNGGAVTQAYLTYATGNTSFKVGRQQLPKALSPFAYSEGWNVFKNTYEAALVVNTDIANTTLVGAYVSGMNGWFDMSDFVDANGDDGIYMLTAQNKSIEGVTLTGTWYHAPDMLGTENANILWADAKTSIAGLSVALQGGTVMGADDIVNGKDTTSFGAKVGGAFGGFDASVSYSTVNDGTVSITNILGNTMPKSPLYTQMVLNNIGNQIGTDNNTWVFRAGTEALGGTIGAAYGMTEDNANANSDYNEFDLTYKTKISENTTVFAAYVYQDDEAQADENNFLRFWARYNF